MAEKPLILMVELTRIERATSLMPFGSPPALTTNRRNKAQETRIFCQRSLGVFWRCMRKVFGQHSDNSRT